MVLRAVPYLWVSDVRIEAGKQDIPRHIFSVESVPSTMWWTWDVDLDMGDNVMAIGMLLVRHERSVEVIHIARSTDGSGVVIPAVHHLRDGWRYPDDATTKAELDNIRATLAFLSFLNSPYIPKSEERMDRRLRGTFKREGAPAERVEELVRFIDLRSQEMEPGARLDEGEAVTYRHRWIVRGHHRAQWYPSLSAHKVIWVSPYVKGPEGAPMLTSAYRVVR